MADETPNLNSGDLGIPELRSAILSNPQFPVHRPVVTLRRIRTLTTYEVLESDLEDLDKASRAENQALAFGCLCVGALLSTVISWIGASSPTPLVVAAYLSATVVLGLASVFFSISWSREKGSRQRLLDRMRSQTITTEETLSSTQVR